MQCISVANSSFKKVQVYVLNKITFYFGAELVNADKYGEGQRIYPHKNIYFGSGFSTITNDYNNIEEARPPV